MITCEQYLLIQNQNMCKSPFMTSTDYFKLRTSQPQHHWLCWKRDLLGSIKVESTLVKPYMFSWSVSVSVCYHIFCHHAQRDKRSIPKGSVILKFGDFRKCTVFERFMAWKPSEKAIMQISTGLPRPGLLAVYLEGMRSHNEGHISTPASYYCS